MPEISKPDEGRIYEIRGCDFEGRNGARVTILGVTGPWSGDDALLRVKGVGCADADSFPELSSHLFPVTVS